MNFLANGKSVSELEVIKQAIVNEKCWFVDITADDLVIKLENGDHQLSAINQESDKIGQLWRFVDGAQMMQRMMETLETEKLENCS